MRLRKLTLLVAVLLPMAGCSAQMSSDDSASAIVDLPSDMRTAVLGAGCFWCVEAFYERIEGVREVVSGYAGGTEANPSYKEVAMGQTSHAEVVKVIYNPEVIRYRELIDFFWTTHDATRGDGVWPDFGPQYRSILLYQNDVQKAAIEASRKKYEADTGQTIATEITILNTFYPAESRHQDYAAKNPNDSYVRSVLNPKLEKLGLD